MNLNSGKLLALATVLFFVGGGYLGLSASQSPQAKSTTPDGQRGSRVILEHADLLRYDAALSRDVQRLSGNVRFRHGNATMTCDTAYLNDTDQTFEAFGSVHMVQGDTIHIFADYLHYDGRTRLAKLRYNVRLENLTTQVFTDSLDYDRVADIAYYFDGGQVVDAQNTLTSEYGQYYPATNDAEFRHNVRLVNDSTEMTTEQLYYNTETRVARYEGESQIRSDSGLILSSRGTYDLERNVGILLDRSEVFSGDRRLTGDSIFYDGTTRFGEAFGQMELHDTARKASLYGDYGYYDAERNYGFATSRAYAVDYSQKDTLYVGADTLELISLEQEMVPDTLGRLPADSVVQHLRAYHQVRVYRRDAQALADSMSYISVDSVLGLYGRPILWSDARQLRGDTTMLFFRDGGLDYSDVKGNAVGVEQMPDKPEFFNQIKGDHIRPYTQDSTIRQIDITGQTVESIYYMKEGKSEDYSAMNRMTSSAMHMTLAKGEIEKILWLGEVKAKVYPIEMSARDSANRLEGFEWLIEQRPSEPKDVISTNPAISDYSPSSLSKFSGARAALAVYEPYQQRREAQRQQRDSIASQPDRHDYQYVLRLDDTSLEQVVERQVQQLLSPSWPYNPFSNQDAPALSSTSPSIGIPERKPLTDE